jgi:hypothetical protein
MFLFTRVASPGSRRNELRRPFQADAAWMIVAAAVGKGAAANIAQRMINQLNLLSTQRTKILVIPPQNSASARPAARRIEPIEQPIDALRQSCVNRKLHAAEELSKPARQGAKLKCEA